MKPVSLPDSWLKADWPLSDKVVAFTSSRKAPTNGTSHTWENVMPGYRDFNLALHVNDDRQRVLTNRDRLADLCYLHSDQLHWLEQVHSTSIVEADQVNKSTKADASYTRKKREACCIMTADCLPVLLCNKQETQVAAAHAGWRGLASGILANTVQKFESPNDVVAWLGPAISQQFFEVGDDVYSAYCNKNAHASTAFVRDSQTNKWFADLYHLARMELNALGVSSIYGGGLCTVADSERFYSYRRDGAASGRMASIIFLSD
jgi:YfiH family protein